jgi:RNA polymerase sigma-B factor
VDKGSRKGSKAKDDSERRDEQQLFIAYRQEGDQEARSQLIAQFMPLARQLALRYAARREPLDDLFQVAAMGLIKAVDNFEPQRGTAFTTYAVPTIAGELKRYFRDKTWAMHVPRGLQEQVIKLAAATGELEASGQGTTSAKELADKLNLSVEEVLEARNVVYAMRIDSLDRPLSDENAEEGTLSDVTGTEDPGLHQAVDRATVQRYLSSLSKREQAILLMRYKEDLTQSEIAERLGCSQMHVSRLLREIVTRLQSQAESETDITDETEIASLKVG